MSSPFESAFAAAGMPCLLTTHGQRLVYAPQGAPPRTIMAGVNENSQVVPIDGNLMFEESLTVFCQRDPVLGIDDPHLGDGITKQNDPPGRSFAWHGDKQNVLDSSWTLRFLRHRPYQVGGNTLT